MSGLAAGHYSEFAMHRVSVISGLANALRPPARHDIIPDGGRPCNIVWLCSLRATSEEAPGERRQRQINAFSAYWMSLLRRAARRRAAAAARGQSTSWPASITETHTVNTVLAANTHQQGAYRDTIWPQQALVPRLKNI